MKTATLTHAQKMTLGWASINNERNDDGDLILIADTRVKNNLTKKGIALLVEASWADRQGLPHVTKDWYIKPEYEPLCASFEEYYELHDKPILGPGDLIPEEWESVAG